jgi:predicted ATP-grasp superfamily ATP-dependent carboligase
MMRSPRVLVTDGDERPALAITRSLGQRGIAVRVGEHHASSLSSASRYAAESLPYPSPYRDAPAFDRFLVELASAGGVDVILPVSDVTTHAVCRLQKEIGSACALAVPSLEAFEQVTNKLTLLDLADRARIRTPRTFFAATIAELDELRTRIVYPVVLKPVRSKMRTKDGWVAAAVEYADSAEGFGRWLDSHREAAGPWLVQERIFGAGIGAFALFDRGEIVAEFAHRRIREKPPAGGVSVLCESIPLPGPLRSEVARLLGPLGWHGVAMVEYKQDAQTGECVLMEVNGRFWGSLQLAIDAGVDFPFLAWELAQGRRPARPSAYRVGIRSRWLLGDLDHLLLRLFRTGEALALPPDSPSRTAAMAAFFTPARGDVRHEIDRLDDLGPFGQETRRFAATLFRSAWRRIGRPSLPDRASELSRLPVLDPR